MNEPAEKTSPDSSAPLRSVHTKSFPQLLADLGASLLVTTYQAGKLVLLRNRAGLLNTHFRTFVKPMGLACRQGRLAIGTDTEIHEFHNVPAVCARLDDQDDSTPAQVKPDSPGLHDACFMPRRAHTTGDVQIHEMAWVGNELWFVNTAFSCLCTRSDVHSFEPRWRPSFITELSPMDSCHLNGLATRDGSPAYVTALGATPGANSWRENKRDGGIVIDIASGEIIARGLSMPHSPRWHRGRLWLLESGRGTLGTVDIRTGKYEPIIELPGFTRGLSFLGPLAFVGLSQVRESAVFSGIPLVDRLNERTCGVWVVNIDSGNTVAFLQFEEAVQEIFAVEALPGIRYPDVINDDRRLVGNSYVLPDDAMHLVPAEMVAS